MPRSPTISASWLTFQLTLNRKKPHFWGFLSAGSGTRTRSGRFLKNAEKSRKTRETCIFKASRVFYIANIFAYLRRYSLIFK